ncbi:MAG: phosphoenolpyruvate carboxykinase (ATP), partial [Planctomycetota bacterium]
MPYQISLAGYGIGRPQVLRNLSAAELYEHAVRYDGAKIASSGALGVYSGEKTGRSPGDKRIVDESTSRDDVWWGDVNRPLPTASFQLCRAVATGYLNGCERVYVLDAFAGWDPHNRIKVRVVCSRPYHALFMRNMLIRPTAEELASFGEPDYVIFNAGQCEADQSVEGIDSPTSVALNFALGEFVILGTEYAGEMKKGVFTIMNYLLPKRGVLSMHCSANEGGRGDATLFFGLSGTGKTTLSADPERDL